MRNRLLFLSPLLAFAGCGGEPGCDDGIYYNANPAFAGQYTASYTPQGASVPTREFRLSVLADGTVGGFARDPVSGGAFDTEIRGRVAVVSNHCNDDRSTDLSFSFSPPGGQGESLEAGRGATSSIDAPLRVRRYLVGDVVTTGTLALERTSQTEGLTASGPNGAQVDP